MLLFPGRKYRRFLSAQVVLFVSLLPRVICAPTILVQPYVLARAGENYQAGREKESRTPAQRKIDSQLLYAIYQMRGQAQKKGTPTTEIRLRKDEKGRVLVDVRAKATEKLVSRIMKLGGAVVSRSDTYHSLLAYLPLAKLETLAKYREVVFIGPASESVTH